MGSGSGYEYHYRFWMDDDIIYRYSSFNIRDDINFLFEIRTSFRLKGGDCDEIIDTERFEIGAEKSDPYLLNCLFEYRLDDYWFTNNEAWTFASEASAFAAAIERTRIDAAPRSVIPIAVEMDVCTVQMPGETLADTKNRAMRSEKLFPLFLMYNRNAFANIKKSPYHDLVPFLRGLDSELYLERVGSNSIEECSVCQCRHIIGDQIAILHNFCGHAFHYRCLISAMLIDTCCPLCSCSLSSAIHPLNLIPGTFLAIIYPHLFI